MSDWTTPALDLLRRTDACSYHAGGPQASEPTALAALALLAWDRPEAAVVKARWLAEQQQSHGSVGVMQGQQSPRWPTSLAVIVWTALEQLAGVDVYHSRASHGVKWLLGMQGKPLELTPEVGHNSMLVGWPWVEGTHSWLEPTCLAVLALRIAGHGEHPRTLEGLRLLHDRLLDDGGANYGNTTVLGQQLVPHPQPSGMVMLNLAGRRDTDGRLGRTLDYLQRALPVRHAAASLGYTLMGLAAHDIIPNETDAWLATAAERSLITESQHRLALLLLAARGRETPLVVLRNEESGIDISK